MPTRSTSPPVQRLGRPRVLLTTEGTYPHYRGGVSTWCDFLIRGVHDVDFTVWALMMNPFIGQQFEFPDNVTQFVGVPLWGVEQPAEYTRDIPSGKVFETSRRTTEAEVEQHFLPLFNRFIDAVTAALFDPNEFAAVLAAMHAYFREWEYRTTWRSRAVWEAYKARLLEPIGVAPPARAVVDDEGRQLPTWDAVRGSFRFLFGGDDDAHRPGEVEDAPTVAEGIEGLHWLYRALQTLNVEVPESDVTHSAAAALCAIPCILDKVERGTPFLLTEHGVYLREQYLNINRRRFPFNLKRFLIDLISAVVQTSYALADQVSPVCAFNGRWEQAYGTDPDKIRVIYNGVSPEVYRPMQVERPSGPTVVQVGRVDPLKDTVTFLRVADAVRRQIPDVQFLHYGNVSDDEYWVDVQQAHRELGLGNTVRFMGFTSEPARAYNQADVVLMTSISEAFPYGVVEALMCGRPLVSTAVGGVREALDGTGNTAPARDVEGLANAVITQLRHTANERAQLSRAARERAVGNFTLDHFVDQYRDSYRSLAERGATERARRITEEALPVAPSPEAPTEEIPVTPAPPVIPTAPAPDVDVAPDEQISVAELVEALRHADPLVRIGAIRAARREPGTEAAVIGALSDAIPQVRREAVRALGRLGGNRAAQALAQVANADPAAEVREAAVDALGPLLGEDFGSGAGA